MYFELQLSAHVFTRIVRNRLKTIPLCINRELTVDGTRVVVERVVVGDTTWIQREQTIQLANGLPRPVDIATQVVSIFSPTNLFNVTVPYLQVKQEILIHLVKSSDLDANGPNHTPPFETLTIYPVYNVSLKAARQTQGGGPLSLSYSLAEVDFGLLVFRLSETQRAEIQQLIAAVQLPPTTVDLGPLSELLKRPVAAINAGIACDLSGSFVALRADFEVFASPISLGPEFFLAGPTNLLSGKEWAMIIDVNLLIQDARGKANSALKGDSKVKLESGPDISWDPSGPAIDISAGVELVDACPLLNIDMDADVDIRLSFSVPSPNTLRTHFHLTAEPSDLGEEIGCALTGALLWPFIGPLFLKDEDVGVGLGAYFGGLAGGPVGTFIGIIAAIETKGLSRDIAESLGSTCKKQDDENYECNDELRLLMALSPPFQSRLELSNAYGVPEGLVLTGFVRNLNERSRGSVTITATPLQWTVSGTCRGGFAIVNQAQINVSGTLDATLCTAYVLHDPLNEFMVTTKDAMVSVRPRFQPTYASAPYPCRVRVVTTAGVRTITFPPPAAITEEQRQRLEGFRLNFTNVCQKWKDSFHERVEWVPERPGPVERPFIQFWQFVVKGMQAGAAIRAEGPAGETLITARPSQAGITHFSLMFPGDQAPSGLSLELLGQRKERNNALEISQQQVLFEQRASLPVGGLVRAMRFEGNARKRRLIILDDDLETTWDVTVPLAPALLRSAARTQNEERAGIVLHTGKRVGTVPTPRVLKALERLSYGGEPQGALGSPRVGGFAETLYMDTKEGARLFDISKPEDPVEIHVYEKPAWYPGIALGGKLMAKHDPERHVVDLYVATANESL